MPFPPDRSIIVAGEYADLCSVDAGASGQDGDGAPNTSPGTAGAIVPCAVYEVQRGMGTAYEADPVPMGVTEYEVAYPADPGIGQALQVINWTGRYGVTFGSPVALATNGPARRPHDFDGEFVVSATLRA